MNKIKNIKTTIVIFSLLLLTLSLSGCNIPLFKKEELKVIGIVIPPLQGTMGGGLNGYAGSSTEIDVKYGYIGGEVQIILNKELPKTFNKTLYKFMDGILYKIIPRNASKEEYNIEYDTTRYRTEGNSIYFGIPVIIGLEKWYNTTVLILPEGIRAKDGSTLKKDWFVFLSVEALNPYTKINKDCSVSRVTEVIKRPATLFKIYKEYNDNRTVAYVLNNETPLLEAPQLNSKEIFKVYSGESCEVVEQLENGWYKVIFYALSPDTLEKSMNEVVPHNFDVYKNWLDNIYGYLPPDSVSILPSPSNPGYIVASPTLSGNKFEEITGVGSPVIEFGYANLIKNGCWLTKDLRTGPLYPTGPLYSEHLHPFTEEIRDLLLASFLIGINGGQNKFDYFGFALKEFYPNGIKEDTSLRYSLKWSNKDLQDFKRIYKAITDFMKKIIKDYKIQKEYQPFIDNYLEAFDKRVAFYLAYHEWGQKYKAESVEPFVSLLLENLNLNKDDEEKIKSFFVCKENATVDECFVNGIDRYILETGISTTARGLGLLEDLAVYKLYGKLAGASIDYSGIRGKFIEITRLDENKYLCRSKQSNYHTVLYWNMPPEIEENLKKGKVCSLYLKPLPIFDKLGPVYEVLYWK